MLIIEEEYLFHFKHTLIPRRGLGLQKIIFLSSFIHPYFPNTKKLPKSSSLHRQRSNLVYFYFI